MILMRDELADTNVYCGEELKVESQQTTKNNGYFKPLGFTIYTLIYQFTK